MPESLSAGSSIFERVPVEITSASLPAKQEKYTVSPGPKARSMWAKEPMPPYRSVGLTAWLEAAATKLGLTDRQTFGNISAIKFVKQVQETLGNLSGPMPDATRKELATRLVLLRLALAVALEGCTNAMVDAASQLGLELPPFTVEPALPFTVPEPVPLMVPPAPSCLPPTDEPSEETEDVDTGQLRGAKPDHKRVDAGKPPKRGVPRTARKAPGRKPGNR